MQKKTIKMYKESIEALEKEWNERIDALEVGSIPATLNAEILNIKKLKPKSRSVKADYKRYERELEYALQWDIDTQAGQRQMESKEQDAFKTFKNKFDFDIEYQEWRNLVETFGALGSATLEQFYRGGANGRGNGDLIRIYKDAHEEGKTAQDMLYAMRRVKRNSRTDAFKMKYGSTTTGLLDALRDELELNKEHMNLQEKRTRKHYKEDTRQGKRFHRLNQQLLEQAEREGITGKQLNKAIKKVNAYGFEGLEYKNAVRKEAGMKVYKARKKKK